MKITAVATRSGDWWAIDIEEVPGAFTQARRLDKVADMARDAVALLKSIDARTIDVEVVPQIDAVTSKKLADALEKRQKADVLEREASQEIATVAKHLASEGLTLREIGTLLGVSYQRAGQLTA